MSDAPQSGRTSDGAAPGAPRPAEMPEDGIEYACPRCGTAVSREMPACPGCGEPLAQAFYAVYRPEPSRAMRVIALAALIAVIAAPVLALLWWLVSQ